MECQRKQLELYKVYDEKTMQKYQIDSMERIYQKLGVKEIRINQFVGDGQSNLSSILPSLGYTMGQMNTAK